MDKLLQRISNLTMEVADLQEEIKRKNQEIKRKDKEIEKLKRKKAVTVPLNGTPRKGATALGNVHGMGQLTVDDAIALWQAEERNNDILRLKYKEKIRKLKLQIQMNSESRSAGAAEHEYSISEPISSLTPLPSPRRYDPTTPLLNYPLSGVSSSSAQDG